MRFSVIIQARCGSTRFPNKVLEKIGDHSILEIIVERLKQSKKIDSIIVATSLNKIDDQIEDLCNARSIEVFRGDERNVLARFYECAEKYKLDNIIRITADCPVIDYALVEKGIEKFKENKFEYISNVNPPTYPDGLDFEIFSFQVLKEANDNPSKSKMDMEHVTGLIKSRKSHNISNSEDFSFLRLTLDEKDDLKVIRNVFEEFKPNIFFSFEDIIGLYKKHKSIFLDNLHIARNSGEKMKKGQKLYQRAKQIIPGGNMLLSKRPEMFLPDLWPSYYSSCSGCNVFDLEGNRYIDMASMGIGTNILGYSHPEVEEVVTKAVKDGNMSTLNCPEEVYLAEELISIHPWSEMVKFARSGGEANSIAVRIARAFTGKDRIAVCGYHGWHDWYLSMNLTKEDELKQHLLGGLEPKGVPKGLKNTVLGFEYNNFDQVEAIIENNKDQLAAIKMEVKRNEEPSENFLEKIRNITEKHGILLIFDECTSGFRETDGGLHKKYKVFPDIAVFGKALGNGHAITAVIGKKEVMQKAQETFISSTFWTERIGPVAALKTLEIMKRDNTWESITKTGENIITRWNKLAELYELDINIFGLPSLCGFSFDYEKNLEYKTFITQEMLKEGFLVGNTVYSSISHTPEIIDSYFEKLKPIFAKIKEIENGDSTTEFLDGPVCHSGFQRLN